jgi:hypothetical protein
MIEYIKYLILAVTIIWFCFEIITVFKIKHRNEDYLYTGTVVKVDKSRSKNNATLRISLIDGSNNHVNIEATFFTNIRWWRQKIPLVNDKVYYYLLNKEANNNQPKLAYGININAPCSRTKRFADLYYYYSVNYLLVFTFVLLALFALFFLFGSRTKDVITIFSAAYLLLRMVLKSFLF